MTERSRIVACALQSRYVFFIDLLSVDVGEFPRDVFRGVWQALESGVTEGKIIAPEAVKEELLDTVSDEQKTWVRRNE